MSNGPHTLALATFELSNAFNRVSGYSWDRSTKLLNMVGLVAAVPMALFVSPVFAHTNLDTLLTMNLLFGGYQFFKTKFMKPDVNEVVQAVGKVRAAVDGESRLQEKEKQMLREHLNEVTRGVGGAITDVQAMNKSHLITNGITYLGLNVAFGMAAGAGGPIPVPPSPTFFMCMLGALAISAFYNFNAAKARLNVSEYAIKPLEEATKLVRERQKAQP